MADNLQQHKLPWPFIIGAGIFLLWRLLAIYTDPLAINNDVAMYLQIASMLLDGQVPFVDIFEINPPLAWYLHVPPVAVAKLTGINTPLALNLAVILAAVVSSMLVLRLLRPLRTDDGNFTPYLLALVPLASVCVFEAVEYVGEREHLLMLALFPYLVLRILRYQGAGFRFPLSVLVGFLTGVVVCLKAPQYGVIVFAVEIFLAARYRTVRLWLAPEIFAMAGAACIYVGHFFLLPDAASESFLNVHVPMVLNGYDAYNSHPSWMQRSAIYRLLVPVTLCCIGAVAGYFCRDRFYRELAYLVLLVALAGAVVFFAQGKGWVYHAMPSAFASLIAVALLLGRVPFLQTAYRKTLAQYNPRVNRVLWSVILVIAAILIIAVPKEFAPSGTGQFELLDTYTDAEDAVLFIGPNVSPGYPLLTQTNRRSGSRYLFMFPVPMLYKHATADSSSPFGYRLPEELQPIETEFLENIAEDIEQLKPKLIFIDKAFSCNYCPLRFSMLRYIESQNIILSVLDDYTKLDNTEDFALYLRHQ